MSRGFVAVDRAALALCQGDDEAMCLFAMTRAQDAAWTPERPEPGVDVGRTFWSERTGLPEGRVRALVARLVEHGRAVVVHPGDRTRTKRIRLIVDVGAPNVTHQPTHQPSTDHEQPPMPVVDGIYQPSTNLPPTDPPQRIEIPPTKTMQPSSNTDVRPTVDLDHLWAALTAFTPKPGAWKLTPERRKHLAARVADHGEAAVYRVAEWVRTSPHDRAVFLRDRGDVTTLLRPEKFATYAAFSDGPAQRTPRNDRDAPLRRGDLFLMPSPDAREGAIDTPFEAL